MFPLTLLSLLSWFGLATAGASALGAKPSVNDEIFVGIVNFRDRRCGVTLFNLFTKSARPEKVHVGVIEYTHTENDVSDCTKDFCRLMGGQNKCDTYLKNVKYTIVSFLDARGPNVARYMQNTLIGDQEFCLQIDAHSDFIPGWDSDLLQSWRALDNEFGILSTAPPALDKLLGVTAEAQSASATVNHLCAASFTHNNVVRNLLPVQRTAQRSEQILSPLWSAGFSFSKCHAFAKTPYDPSLLYLFDGEEFAMFARLWTRGYDVYTPTHTIVVHDYDNALFNKLPEKMGAMSSGGKAIDFNAWSRFGQSPEWTRQMYDDAHGRVLTMLGASTSATGQTGAQELVLLGKYGLGSKRTLQQLIDFTGLDTRTWRVVGDRCSAPLQRVTVDHDGGDAWLEEGDPWGRAGEERPAGGEEIPLLSGGSFTMYSDKFDNKN